MEIKDNKRHLGRGFALREIHPGVGISLGDFAIGRGVDCGIIGGVALGHTVAQLTILLVHTQFSVYTLPSPMVLPFFTRASGACYKDTVANCLHNPRDSNTILPAQADE